MNRAMVGFLAGAATTAAAMFLAGGGARAGVLIGAALITMAAIAWPRAAARFLLALADAGEKFRESFHRRPSTIVDKPAAPSTIVDTHTSIQADVIAALVNQGMTKKQARARVEAAGPAGDFETLFRKAVSA